MLLVRLVSNPDMRTIRRLNGARCLRMSGITDFLVEGCPTKDLLKLSELSWHEKGMVHSLFPACFSSSPPCEDQTPIATGDGWLGPVKNRHAQRRSERSNSGTPYPDVPCRNKHRSADWASRKSAAVRQLPEPLYAAVRSGMSVDGRLHSGVLGRIMAYIV